MMKFDITDYNEEHISIYIHNNIPIKIISFIQFALYN